MATANDDFEYYTKINQLQEFLKSREARRMELDHQFNKYMRSDEKRSSSQAAQLQAYWKKLCENERASQARNQKLLKEFDRVEAHVASLSVRTERLRQVQDHYKRQVDQRYPNWRQRYIEQLVRQRKQHTSRQPVSHHSPAVDNSGRRWQTPPPQGHPHCDEASLDRGVNDQHSQQLQSSDRVGTSPTYRGPRKVTQDYVGATLNREEHDQSSQQTWSSNRGGTTPTYHGSRGVTQDYPREDVHMERHSEEKVTGGHVMNRSLEDQARSGHAVWGNTGEAAPSRDSMDRSSLELVSAGRFPMDGGSQGQVLNRTNPEGILGEVSPDRPLIDADGSLMEIHSDKVPKGRGPEEPVLSMSQDGSSRVLASGTRPHAASGTFVVTEPGKPDGWAPRDERHDPEPAMSPIQAGAVAHRQIFGGSPTPGRTHSGETGEVSSRTDPFSSVSGEESQEEEEDSQLLVAPGHSREQTGNIPSGPAIPGTGGMVVDTKPGDEDEYIPTRDTPIGVEGDVSLTMSGDRGSPPPDDESDIESDLSLPLSEDQLQSSPNKESAVSPGPELSTDGYLHLLQGLEYIIDRSEGRAEIYDGSICPQEQKKAIAKDANSKLPMDTHGSLNLSRVVLQELPLLIQATPRGYLISDQVLKSDRPILEVTIRSAITTNALPFWDRTLKHMVFLVRRGYSEPDEIAQQVAPLMLAKGSPMGEKAVKVVTNLLEDAVEEPTLEESSLTHTSIGETPPAPPQESTAGRQSVPPLKLDMSGEVGGSSEEEDSFFDQDVSLKETDAYRQMLQSIQPKSGRQNGDMESGSKDAEALLAELEESSSSDRDVDALVSPPATGRSSDGKQKKTVLSSLGGTLDQAEASPTAPEAGAAQIDTEMSKGTPSPDKSDVISSASEPPQDGGGYVPSAIDNSLKSSGRRSNAMQRSASFWGEESDLDESEMSVPMGTGGVDDDKDDFDFYD